MSWFIEGSCEKLHLGVEGSGNPSIWGDASNHTVDPVGGDLDYIFYERLRKADCSWSIHPSNEEEENIDIGGTGFYARVQAKPDKPIAAISFFENPDLVGVTISLPKHAFESAMSLFKNVLLSSELTYMIYIDFTGFSVPEAETDTPTIEQFLKGSGNGSVYVSEGVSLSIKRTARDA